MARMIPPRIASDRDAPPGERHLFARLRDESDTEGWIVLHSLDVAEHSRRVSGEVDFVCIVPGMGVLCVEVKSHRRIRVDEEGRWRYGASDEVGRSPFKQVRDTMHALRETVHTTHPDLRHIVFWSAVVLPHARLASRTLNPIEWHDWELIDEGRLQAVSAGHALGAVLHHARGYLSSINSTAGWFDPGRSSPSREESERLAAVLRPQFDFYESPASRARKVAGEVIHYTQKQFRALDKLASNPRVLFTGPAGTGKTLIAIEAARRAAEDGKRVLLTCYNRLLGAHLQREATALPAVTAGTFHGFMLDEAGVSPQENRMFWSSELPGLVTDRLLSDDHRCGRFDLLIVDEVQDLSRPEYLDVMDLLVAGGLRDGRWLLFGDDAGQAIYRHRHRDGLRPTGEALAERGVIFTSYLLDENCRNTPDIGGLIEQGVKLSPGYSDYLRPPYLSPELLYYRDEGELREHLVSALEALYSDGYTGEDVVLLFPSLQGRETGTGGLRLPAPWDQRVRHMAASGAGHARFATIATYKGLDAPAAIVAGIETIDAPEAEDLFYIGTSRARDRLVVVAHERVQQEFIARLTGAGDSREAPGS